MKYTTSWNTNKVILVLTIASKENVLYVKLMLVSLFLNKISENKLACINIIKAFMGQD